MILITGSLLPIWIGPVRGEDGPAFEQARREGKPIILVVGDWRTRPAPTRAEGVVTAFVDRDERPDLAEIYSSALVLLDETGRPRLPFRLILTPDARPASAARELAPEQLAAEFKEKRGVLEAKAGALTAALREAQAPAPAKGTLRNDLVSRALRGLFESQAARQECFGPSPGPPPPGAFRLLLGESRRTGNAQALRAALSCLDALARGGLPVREMGAAQLAPNALILDGYRLAQEATGEAAYGRSAAALADWALGSTRVAGGGFRNGVAADVADHRVFTGANGLMIGALARLGRPDGLEAARETAQFLLARSASLPRYVVVGAGRGSAFLEDYALLADGLLALHSATDEARWREAAVSLVGTALARFIDPGSGSLFDTDAAHGPAILRLRNGYDGVWPAGNAIMASVLLRLGRATGETRYTDLARRTVTSFLGDLEQAPSGLETLAAVAAELLPAPAAGDSGDGALPSQVTVGPVEITVALSLPRVVAGGTVEARVVLRVAEGWSVVPHQGGGKERVGLTVGVPAGGVAMEVIRYPEGDGPLALRLRVPANSGPGERHLRFRVGFQACRGQECRAPESALLEAPLVVLPR